MAFGDEFNPGWRAHLPEITPRLTPGGALRREAETRLSPGREETVPDGNGQFQTDLAKKQVAMKEAMRIYLSDDWRPNDTEWLGADEAPLKMGIHPDIWPEVRRILRNISGYTYQEKKEEEEINPRLDGTPGPAGIYQYVGLTLDGQHGILKPPFWENTIRSTTVRRLKTVSFGALAVRRFFLQDDEIEWKRGAWNLGYFEWNGSFVRDISHRELNLCGFEDVDASPGRLLSQGTYTYVVSSQEYSTPELGSIESTSPKSCESVTQGVEGEYNGGMERSDHLDVSQIEAAQNDIVDRIIVISPHKTAKLLDLDAATNGDSPLRETSRWRTNSLYPMAERCSSVASGVDKKCQEKGIGRKAIDYVLDRPKTGAAGFRDHRCTRNRQVSHALERRARESATRIHEHQKAAEASKNERNQPSVVVPSTGDPRAKENILSKLDDPDYDPLDNMPVMSVDSLDTMINDILCDDLPASKNTRGSTHDACSPETSQIISRSLPTRHSGHVDLLSIRDSQKIEGLSDNSMKVHSRADSANGRSSTERMQRNGVDDNGTVVPPAGHSSASNESTHRSQVAGQYSFEGFEVEVLRCSMKTNRRDHPRYQSARTTL